MRRFFHSSLCLAQSATRSFIIRGEEFAIRQALAQRRKALSLDRILQADLLINRRLAKNDSVKGDQWGAVRKELLNGFEELTDVNVDSQVCDICYYYNRVDQGIDYFRFLESNKYPLNLSTKTNYLRMMSLRNKLPTAEEEKGMLKIYNEIRKEYEILDPKSATNCILGLSLTARWQESFQLLDMIKVMQGPGTSAPSSIICAALRNNRPDLAWKLFDELLVELPLQQNVYIEYLNYCKRNFTQDKLVEEVEKIFLAWQKYNVLPHKAVIDEYEEFFKSMRYTGYHTAISKVGICYHCKNQLKETHITKADFKILATAMMTKLIIGKDVYRNTSPEELKRYLIFLKTMKPYDVVIDGLNVAYAGSKKLDRPDSRGLVENIFQVVNYFRKRGKRTLVVGRVHMKWWKSRDTKTLESITDAFYMKNLSQDDQFLLHLTLTSGADTFFVSKDFMRQHLHGIEDPALKQLFKNWQMSRQYFFMRDPVTHRIKLIPPFEFDPTAQKNDEGWHIPYTTNSASALPRLYSAPENWLCLKHENRKKC